MHGIKTLKIVTETLRTIGLPPLRRPSVKPNEPKTEALVKWGICVYVYSMIAHMQKVLAGLVQLAEAENVAASAPLCRHGFEWAALSCYLTAEMKDRFKQRDWEEAWKLLTKIALGSRWIGEHGSKYAENPAMKIPINPPEPVWLPKAVKKYESYQTQNSREAEVLENYSLLCEFSHPNGACLLRHHQYEEDGEVTRFIDPDTQKESFLPLVNCCLIDLLTFSCKLLGMADESSVRPKVLLALKELARLAPARLTGSVPV